MPYSWTGTDLEVDLTHGTIQKVKSDPQLVRDYLGGKGLGARLLWDRVPPETEPFSPDNLIIISNGLLVGTPVPSANRCVMTYVSPVTEHLHYSSMGGFFAPELKHAGYDNIIIRGQSPTPVYLWINNDQVELRDARHLWGKDTYDTRDMLREELQNEKIQIACIGQAGENKVYAAAVQCGTGASASRGGIGALWGDKKLKAIAVFGTKDVNLANPTKLYQLSEHILDRAERLTQTRRDKAFQSSTRGHSRNCWYGNFDELEFGSLPPDSELAKSIANLEAELEVLVKTKGVRCMACYNCRVHCRQTFPYHGGLTFLKCQSLSAIITQAKYAELDWALDCYNMCEDWGLDSLAFFRYVALGIDLYQRGILTKEDTDGMHLEFGNPEVFVALMKKVVHREGIGNILANGTLRAARQIGRGAEERVNVVKGLELWVPAPYNYHPLWALALAVSDREDLGAHISGQAHHLAHVERPWTTAYPPSREEAEAYFQGGWGLHPKEIYEKYYLPGYGYDETDSEPIVHIAAYEQEHYSIMDSLGTCARYSGFGGYLPISNLAQMAELTSSATGLNIDEPELRLISQRIVNLIRADSVRRGLKRQDDTVPKIFFERDGIPPRKKLDRAQFNKWLDAFYELRGWNKEGVPTKETLKKYGLDDVRQDLEQRGILTEKEVAAGVPDP